MNCNVCGNPILRRYFKQKFHEKEVILCPMCNKKWAEISEKIEEIIEKTKKNEAVEAAKEAEDESGRTDN